MIKKINLGLVIVTLFGIMVPHDRLWGADANGPISHWKLDEGSGTIAGDSAGTNHGSIYGAAWTTGQIGGALSFDGVNDYVGISDSPFDFGATTDFSYCCWVKTTSSSYKLLVNKAMAGHYPYEGFCLYMWFGKVDTEVIDSSYNRVFCRTTSTISDGQWHFIAVVADRDGNLEIYNNGVREDFKPLSAVGDINNNLALAIGRSMDYNGLYFGGLVDDVRIYNRALSAQEVQDIYLEAFSPAERAIAEIQGAIDEKLEAVEKIDAALEKENKVLGAVKELLKSGDYGDLTKKDILQARQKIQVAITQEQVSKRMLEVTVQGLEDALTALGFPPVPNEPEPNLPEPNLPEPFSHWKLDEGSGTIAHDSVGAHHGTIYGAAWTTGRINGALSFDGDGDYVGIADSDDFVPNMGTVAAWIKLDTWGENGFGRIMCHRWYVSGNSYGFDWIARTATRSFGFQIFNGVLSCGVGPAPDSLSLNTWYHVAVVWNGTNMISYVNGSQGTVSLQTTAIGNPSVDLFIGRSTETPSYDFDGIIDDVRFYDKALSADEVLQIYQGML